MLAVRKIFEALLIRNPVQQKYQAQEPFVRELISASQWDANLEHSEASLGMSQSLICSDTLLIQGTINDSFLHTSYLIRCSTPCRSSSVGLRLIRRA